jgi:hypothetical protein
MELQNITVTTVALPKPDNKEEATPHFLLTLFFINGSDLEQVQTLIPQNLDHETVIELFSNFDQIIEATIGQDDER